MKRTTFFSLSLLLITSLTIQAQPVASADHPLMVAKNSNQASRLLAESFQKQDIIVRNRTLLAQQLDQFSDNLEAIATSNPDRYQLIERAYTNWLKGTGYGKDLRGLDLSNTRAVYQVLEDIDLFSRTAKSL